MAHKIGERPPALSGGTVTNPPTRKKTKAAVASKVPALPPAFRVGGQDVFMGYPGYIYGDPSQEDIEDQAKALTARSIVSPQTIRILTLSFPLIEIRSLDVLTGRYMIVANDMACLEDGKTAEEDSNLESGILDHGSSTPSGA
ncbi:hypothetical protein F4804DRAFT_336923 [Jackrogersella minutella]|nr:hypothetical protein F4804DRAFT_336923 [Jackrogersella minutella]